MMRIQMNITDYETCPDKPDEFAGVCNKWNFMNAKCTGGKCLSNTKNVNGKLGAESESSFAGFAGVSVLALLLATLAVLF